MAENITIGLFGTCDNSKWRDEFIEHYELNKISFFNPDAGDNWHPGLIDEENRHLLEDEIILFPVLAESLGLGSLAEIGFSVNRVMKNIQDGSNQYLVVLIDDVCAAESASESEIIHSNRTRKLVKSKLIEVTHPSIIVVDGLQSMMLASFGLIDVIESLEEVRSNFDYTNIA